MSHRASGALFFILTSFVVVGAVHAQEPKADEAARPPQTQPQAAPTATAQTPTPGDQSTPAPQPDSKSQSAADKQQPVTTIVVNIGPSADILRSARNAGFTVKIAGGTTHFCKTEAPIGTRLTSEHCLNEQQLTLFLDRAQDQREKLSHLLGAPATAH
jgi:hypothetical protein